MLWKKLSALTVLILATSPGWAQDCYIYNTRLGPFFYGSINSIDHSTGNHIFSNEQGGWCTYTGGPGECAAVATATSFSYVEESGKLTIPGFVHEIAWNDANGTASATYPSSAVASSEGAGAVRECPLFCGFGMTISSPGGSISYSGGSPKWADKHTYTNNCPARIVNSGCGVGASGGPCPVCTPENCGPSPILIDTRNEGFHFTDPQTPDGYVSFRFGAKIRKVSWPDWKTENAWLVYDSRGVIDGADDLFGNYTEHSDGGLKNHPNPNGFLALAWYDRGEQGGNLDGVIDKRDRIWSKLRLWKPKHCHLHPDEPCVALDSELSTLDAAGVHSLSLVYSSEGTTDSYGNVCSFKAMVNPDEGETQKSRDGRFACDFNLAERKEDAR